MINNINVLTFGVGSFLESQKLLSNHLTTIGITKQINLNNDNLPLDFITSYSDILSNKRGYGYCIWKPYLILQELEKISDDEILIYIDSTDLPDISFFNSIIDIFKTQDYVFLNRGYNHGQWTKRDCFVLMNCDVVEYHNHVQLEAGVIGMKPTLFNKELLKEWFHYSTNKNILTEEPNICGQPNLDNFKEHRYDQSVLTNLFIKYKLNSYFFDTDKIKYNYNQPKNYANI